MLQQHPLPHILHLGPCWAIRATAKTRAAAAAAAQQGTCQRTKCQICTDCMAAAQPFVWNYWNSSQNSTQLAILFSAACSQTAALNTTGMCGAVTDKIAASENGNLARRAAALCAALQLCGSTTLDSSCLVAVTPIGAAVPTSVAANKLSICSVEGLPFTNTSSGTFTPGSAQSLAPLPAGKSNEVGSPESAGPRTAAPFLSPLQALLPYVHVVRH